jgi:hypothetical protein
VPPVERQFPVAADIAGRHCSVLRDGAIDDAAKAAVRKIAATFLRLRFTASSEQLLLLGWND